jgi:alpha-tubulin suppressor-like RCC1 family protein
MAFCWGKNNNGELGNGTTTDSASAQQVDGDSTWTLVKAGEWNTCGIKDGALYCWGTNLYGANGNGLTTGATTTPQRVGLSSNWTDVDVGSYNACGAEGGNLYCWGLNGYIYNGNTYVMGPLAGLASNYSTPHLVPLGTNGTQQQTITDLAVTAVASKADLSWTTVPNATYNIYRWAGTYGPYTVVALSYSNPNGVGAYVDTGLTKGVNYRWVVTSVVNGVESLPSNEVNATP